MGRFITVLLLLTCSMGFSQKLSFDYDVAGNQILRQLCTNCHSRNSNVAPKEIADLKKEDLQKFYPTDVISYYPNPVKEELYLQWELINGNQVNTIQLYAMSGQLLKLYDKLENSNNYTMSFQSLPQGIYSLLLLYTNGDQKSIKIIKE